MKKVFWGLCFQYLALVEKYVPMEYIFLEVLHMLYAILIVLHGDLLQIWTYFCKANNTTYMIRYKVRCYTLLHIHHIEVFYILMESTNILYNDGIF
jgi:hypothetical protein